MKRLTPIKAIRKKCLDCCAGQTNEVRACSVKICALHPYRMGHRPTDDYFTTEEGNEEKTCASPIVNGNEGQAENGA